MTKRLNFTNMNKSFLPKADSNLDALKYPLKYITERYSTSYLIGTVGLVGFFPP